MRSIGVSHNGKDLHADLVVQSLGLLEPDVFDRLLKATKSWSSDRESGLRGTWPATQKASGDLIR